MFVLKNSRILLGTRVAYLRSVGTRSFHFSRAALAVKEVTSATDFNKDVSKDKLSFVDFYATWCGPCKAMGPFVDKFSDTYKDIKFYKVDVDKLADLSTEFGISAMPTFVLLKDGDVVSKVIGANPNAVHNLLIRATKVQSK